MARVVPKPRSPAVHAGPWESAVPPSPGDARLGPEGLGKGPLGLWSEAWERVLRGHACRPDLDNSKDSFSGESVTGRGGCSGPSRW